MAAVHNGRRRLATRKDEVGEGRRLEEENIDIVSEVRFVPIRHGQYSPGAKSSTTPETVHNLASLIASCTAPPSDLVFHNSLFGLVVG